MLIAVLIEGTQALLPSSFSRGYAWEDLGASLVGGSIGIVLALRRGGANNLSAIAEEKGGFRKIEVDFKRVLGLSFFCTPPLPSLC